MNRQNRRLAILLYHRVLSEADELIPDQTDRDMFRAQVQMLARCFNVLPLSEGVTRLQNRTLPGRAVSITFDDGYRDNREIALPLLERYGLTATFYIATGFLDGGRMWNDTVIELVRRFSDAELDLSKWQLGSWPLKSLEDRRRAVKGIISQLKYRDLQDRSSCIDEIESVFRTELPNDLMMNVEDVRALYDSGMEIGAHTVHHPILSKVDRDTANAEILSSKTALEQMLGTEVTTFAYPNGRPGKDYSSRDVEIVRSLGFHSATSTQPGCADANSDLYQLPRLGAWDRSRLKFGLRMALKFR